MITFKLRKFTDEEGNWLEGTFKMPDSEDKLGSAVPLGKNKTDTEVEEDLINMLVLSAKSVRGLNYSVKDYENWLTTGGAYFANKDREDSLRVYASQKEPLDYEIVRE